ncbi:NitT/TauT family transport system substrate-binding protein [Evansella caseinilytica]|uniref:NitT/TauT family transport system substrate-binding protein n=1 Tax=Evansella caseinilytica TaxID=1503961 RepID=A0A1H3RZC1_9BACI|nr:MqnA/MqnD/SBP family protein [Evansella caseinilytica]SDZ30930.1 NitT/TauT family transport system substrate-binding protein [Evansella caseinilytica]
MTKIAKCLLLACCFFLLAACNATGEEGEVKEKTDDGTAAQEQQGEDMAESGDDAADHGEQTFTFLAPKSAPLLPALLMEEGTVAGPALEISTWDTIEQLLAAVQGNEADFAAVPLNVAANLHAKGLPVQLIDVNTWGTIYLVSVDPEVATLEDLENEEIYVSHQSGPPDILFQHFLDQDGLTDKVTVHYSTPAEISQLLLGGKVKHAVLPEPALSAARSQLQGDFVQVIDFQAAWETLYGMDLPQAGIIVNSEFAAENPQAVEQFLQSYQEAIDLLHAEPEKAAALAEEAIGMKQPLIETALNHMKIMSVAALDAKPVIEQYFEVLFDSQPDAIGGQLPDEGFYFQE